MIDCRFPHIVYDPEKTHQEWGECHGESFRQEIQELAIIRKDLMLSINPSLKNNLEQQAKSQLQQTSIIYKDIAIELTAIAKAANISETDIIILNNYTDFRDIQLSDDQGCTSLGLNRHDQLSAQTWDMHASAKNYLCTIEIPGEMSIMSIVGCVGMMGANKHSIFVGVNNLGTLDASAGVIWPALVRQCLKQSSFSETFQTIKNAPVTSGHNYLISDGQSWLNYESSPSQNVVASELKGEGIIYHTNHCLSSELQSVENKIASSSTTKERYHIVEQQCDHISNYQELKKLLQSHDGYPKSICSHYQSGAADPSTTCGGAIFNHQTMELNTWRGCQQYDDNYVERTLIVG